ncbi:hypothetical protein N7471_004629 [Penicillium samsonianum]|uniref:uncharacterized protein n=1 Tax=Penicillium samsonianum TaxID=1882272 RepID=UPI0025488A16|nr:uncharacterized protein N7471_004629 [Penicillium samsonianum]KAJ6138143.1 hypothetical protein N7471_004629 [Penicillium samsonianum]
MFPKILLAVVFLLGLFSSALALGELGITRDTSIGDGNARQAYNSKCTFKTQPGNADFLKMIHAAYNEMKAISLSKKQNDNRPSAMIGLSIGNEVYFASSVTGPKQFIYHQVSWKGGDGTLNPDLSADFKEVTDALKECAEKSTTGRPQHGNNANCGEIMSTLLWMVDHEGKSPRDHSPKIAAYNEKGYLKPCSSDPGDVKWGCAQWTQIMGLEVVQNIANLNLEAHDFPKPEEEPKPLMLSNCQTVEVDKKKTKPSQE